MTSFDPLEHPILFSRPGRLAAPGTWVEHIPFGAALIDTLRPKSLVELGTFSGNSYCAFCQAIKELGLPSRAAGIGRWSEAVPSVSDDSQYLADLRAYHDPLYGEFSRLIQSEFVAAAAEFPDRSVDLLNFDGMYPYEVVHEAFAAWGPKISDQGVVLLHNTILPGPNSGLARLWTEMKESFPHFEFDHGCGLGVLGFGRALTPAVQALLSVDGDDARWIRQLFSTLGARLAFGPDKQRLIQVSLEKMAGQQAAPTQTNHQFASVVDGSGAPAGTPVSAGATVSVIVLNRDGRENLRMCLASLAELDFPPEQVEVIVVDNGSADSSGEMVRTDFPRTRLLQNETNLGFSRGANQGAAESKSRYLAFLNNDMRVDSNWLIALVRALEEDPELACAGSMVMDWEGKEVQFFGRQDDLFGIGFGGSSESSTGNGSIRANPYVMFASGGAMLIRRDRFEELGGFDPEYFMYHEDVDLGWRLSLRGHRSILCPLSIVYHKGGASSRKLPNEFLDMILQRNMLLTTFKNMEAGNLVRILPVLFFFLLERSRRWLPARESAQDAIQGFRAALPSTIAKRVQIQAARRISDAELFSLVGHPFHFLLDEQGYEFIRNDILLLSPLADFDPGKLESVRAAVAEWLDEAHFLFERSLWPANDRVLEYAKVIDAAATLRSTMPIRILRSIRRRFLRHNGKAHQYGDSGIARK